MKLMGIMIGSENPKALGEFYTKILGQPGWQQDDWYGFEVGGSSLMVGPHSEVKGQNLNPGRLMISFETTGVKAEFERLKGLGAVVVAEPYLPDANNSPDMWLATVADPDDNYLQLANPWK